MDDVSGTHRARTGNISIRLALAKSHQDLAILEHLELPPARRLTPADKKPAA
jgi:hypothetical protein